MIPQYIINIEIFFFFAKRKKQTDWAYSQKKW